MKQGCGSGCRAGFQAVAVTARLLDAELSYGVIGDFVNVSGATAR